MAIRLKFMKKLTKKLKLSLQADESDRLLLGSTNFSGYIKKVGETHYKNVSELRSKS